MQSPLIGQKTAILVANGFSEQDLIKTQRVIQQLGSDTRIVSMDQGLVNSWNGTGWGLNFAADQALNTALAADYSALVIPGGQRSMDKLKLTAHTRRFINGFLDSDKPVVAVNEALDILTFTELVSGRDATGSADLEDALVEKGGNFVKAPYVVDGNLLSCVISEDDDAALSVFAGFLTGQSVQGSEEREAVAA